MGVVVREMIMDTKMAVERVTANSRKSRPTIPPISRSGIKTAISERLMVKTVKPISSAPFNAAAKGCMPFSRWRVIFSITTMASSTTNPVEMVRAISERLSRLYPNRYITASVPISETGTATRGNQRGAAVAQEDKHHHDDQADGNEQRLLDVADRSADGRGAVENDGGIDAERNGCLDKRKLRSYAVDRIDDIGAGLAVDDDHYRGLAVQIAGGPDVLHGIRHLGDVGEADSRAFAITDHQRLVVGRQRDLVVGQDVRGHDAIGDLAFGKVGVLQAQNGLQIRKT